MVQLVAAVCETLSSDKKELDAFLLVSSDYCMLVTFLYHRTEKGIERADVLEMKVHLKFHRYEIEAALVKQLPAITGAFTFAFHRTGVMNVNMAGTCHQQQCCVVS